MPATENPQLKLRAIVEMSRWDNAGKKVQYI